MDVKNVWHLWGSPGNPRQVTMISWMNIDFYDVGKEKIDMVDYIGNMIVKCTKNITGTVPTPEDEDLFADGKGDPLPKDKSSEFHTIIAKGLFKCKSVRPYIYTTVEALYTLVKNPTTDYCKNMIQMINYLNGTHKNKAIPSMDNLHVIKWYVDKYFSVCPDFKVHTGGVMTLGDESIKYLSRKKKLNT